MTNDDFANAVRCMIEWSNRQSSTYISEIDAAPFVAHLPLFWREPARIMATAGYYGSADAWIHDYAE